RKLPQSRQCIVRDCKVRGRRIDARGRERLPQHEVGARLLRAVCWDDVETRRTRLALVPEVNELALANGDQVARDSELEVGFLLLALGIELEPPVKRLHVRPAFAERGIVLEF